VPRRFELPPSAWVRRFATVIPKPGPVLDLACGRGRHTRFLRALDYQVVALDRDAERLRQLAADDGIEAIVSDLENGAVWPLGNRRFTGIIVTNYLYRPVFESLVQALAPNGVLIFETFSVGNERYGKPSNPAFLLRPGELLDAFGEGLHIVAYEHGKIAGPRPRNVQRICILKRAENSADPVRIG